MGAQMELVKDSEGNSHAIFDESSLYDDSQMGNSLSDFEILQILNDKNNSFVSKVRSLNNHKIYAMKKINLNNNQYLAQQYINQAQLLQTINNPHIVKHYNSFMDNSGNLYLIMEYMNNGDIYGFIKAHQVLNKDIKEEEIWNILLQCISALDYFYSKNLGNSGIRFTNIFMNNEQNAKINIYADYDSNKDYISDIYSLGKYFYCLCFSQHERVKNEDVKTIDDVDVVKEFNQKYSKELMEIIYEMLELGQNNQQININMLYNKVKDQYVKKYARNTSIESVLRCMNALPDINNKIFSYEQTINSNIDKYYINYWYLKAIKALSGKNDIDLKLCVEEFRRAIASENSKLDGNKEIDPLYLIAFLLQKMHIETNEKKYSNNINGQNSMGNYVINSVFNGEEEDKTNKEQMLYKFLSYSQANIKSPISELFFGILKTKRNCQICKTGNYSFSNFCLVNFDLSNYNNQNDFNLIKDGFEREYNYGKPLEPDKAERVYCERCLTYQKHLEFNRYYVMNHHLIISFIRGNDYKNYTKIDFEENINLQNYVDEKRELINFYLVGSINRIGSKEEENEKFIYFVRDRNNYNYWTIYNNGSQKLLESAPINEIKNTGQIILLFYNNKKSNFQNY